MGSSSTLNRAVPELGHGARIIKGHNRTFQCTGSSEFSFVAFAIVATAFLSVPSGNKYPGALVSAFVFFLVQCFLPACRPVWGKVLCPWNWALFVFFLQLVLLPLSVLLFGPCQSVLPFLPSDRTINLAMLMNSAAFVAFCATCSFFARRAEIRRQSSALQQDSRVVGSGPSLGYIVLNGVIGFAGLFFAFGSLGNLAQYFSDPAGYLSQVAGVSDKLGPAAGNFMRPFMGSCIVMLWCRWLDRKHSQKAKSFGSVVTVVAIVAVCLSNATFNYNRGSMVVPLVAMLAVIVSGPRRVPWKTVVSAAVTLLVVLLLLPLYGVYRSNNFTAQELFNDRSVRDVMANNVELTEMFQIYGGAPQFLGFLLENAGWGAHPQWGKVLVSSTLSPLPILGKPFRENTGTAIYNMMIYDVPDISDQVPPFQGEAFLDFHLAGVLAGFSLLGWIAFKFQTAFVQSQSFFELFIWQYFSVWTFFLIFGSLSVTSQIAIFFCWPFYLYFVSRHLHSRRGRSRARGPYQTRLAHL